MGINFTYYPTSNRVPGVFVEMDPSQANTGTALQNTLLIGQMLPSGTAPPAIPVLVSSAAQVTALCGAGSVLEAMAQRYLLRDPFGPLWLLPLADDASAVAAHCTITVSGAAANVSGTLSIYIAGQLVQVGVSAGDNATSTAQGIAAAITASATLPVTAVSAAAVVTVTARNKGLLGNDIQIVPNYLGAAGGQYPIDGVTLTIVPMAGGTVNPSLATGLGNLSSTAFDFIGLPYTDTVSLDTMQDFLADDVGRWSWSEMIYGGCFSAFRGTLGTCTAFGQSRNDQHTSIMAFYGSPDPVWIWTAEVTAAAAASLRVDPGLPLQYIGTTLLAPPIASQWTIGERNSLLYDGLSSFRVQSDNSVEIERMCTTYQKNAAGAADDSYLDVETMYGLMFVARDLSNYLLSRYARKKLVSDATQILYGSNCVNAPMIKASVVSEYRALELAGYVQNSATFAKALQVENAGNGLIKILAPVDLVNQLRQIAILLQFRKS
jgi:phage tail sheath gpL-like